MTKQKTIVTGDLVQADFVSDKLKPPKAGIKPLKVGNDMRKEKKKPKRDAKA